jgi:D-glucuronyl C5-epimerase C-terminus
MRRRRFGIALIVAVCALSAGAGNASAARVIVLGANGHASVRDDPYVTGPAITPAPGARAAAATASRPRARAASGAAHDTLAHLRRTRAISARDYRRYLTTLDRAGRAAAHLARPRAHELEAVLLNIHDIAARGALTASRLPALFLTLDRNLRWWTRGPLLDASQRVEFAGSEIVWQYYPGQGLELQELGSFGKADGLYTGGPKLYPRMKHLLSELIPLGARRGRALVWEYYFGFDGGVPPWTSAMSQGTALEALSRAYKAFHQRRYLDVAHQALPIFGERPPTGVSVRTQHGLRYLLYSFAWASDVAVINGFLQSLIGLDEYAETSHNARAARLFAAGDAEARLEVPHYDTGHWSLYQPGELSSYDYHVLVTGFLRELCTRTHAKVYCDTASRFERYLKHPPV